MARVILLNDVHCEMDNHGLLVGNADLPASEKGLSQSKIIAKYFHTKIRSINLLAASDLGRLSKLLHCIRVESPKRYLLDLAVRTSDALRERDFGVLSGSCLSLESDVFTHSRITGENGESLSQCRERAFKFLNAFLSVNVRALVVSHPFICQVITNAVLHKPHTYLTEFWMRKGSFIEFDLLKGQFAFNWKFLHAFNALDDREYTEDEIYCKLLGKKGHSSDQAS